MQILHFHLPRHGLSNWTNHVRASNETSRGASIRLSFHSSLSSPSSHTLSLSFLKLTREFTLSLRITFTLLDTCKIALVLMSPLLCSTSVSSMHVHFTALHCTALHCTPLHPTPPHSQYRLPLLNPTESGLNYSPQLQGPTPCSTRLRLDST